MSQTATLPPRSEIPESAKWNAPKVFADTAAWRAEYQAVEALLPQISPFEGTLSQSSARLTEWFALQAEILPRVERLYFYAVMSKSVESTNQEAVALSGEALSLYSRVAAALSFSEPEILAIGEETINQWLEESPALGYTRHYFHDLFRKQQHVRSGEVEEVLAQVQAPFTVISDTWDMLVNADMRFEPAVDSDGNPHDLGQGNVETYLESYDRELRRTAWENYADSYLALKNTLTSNYNATVNADVFNANVRRYPSSLEAVLFRDNIPSEVFHNLIDTYKANLPTWHRYWAVRRKALGVETLNPYDIWAPLTQNKPVVSYEQAVDWICEGMKPLGEDYVNTLRQGCLEDRWVDIYPNQGKVSGAFSYGAYNTDPYILMSFDNSVSGLSTLAHELGHSMHSHYTRTTQPYLYGDYTMFAAEVASNFNQALVRSWLFDTNDDKDFQIAVIEEAMSNFHRYFFIMPTLARFELEAHQRVEKGQSLTADSLIDLMTDLFAEGYGDEMHVDRERVGITWAQFGHLYANYYVFQYATGISAAHVLANRILSGTPNAVENYLGFLKAGGNGYPVDALKAAGVDMATPTAVEETFKILADYVDRLEKLTQ
jgi:oligoendopeptidase F